MPTALERIIASHAIAGTLTSALRLLEKEERLCYLGILVELGKGHCIAALRDAITQLSAEEAERLIAVSSIPREEYEEVLFTDPSFAFSLRLTICKITSEEPNWKPAFLKRLLEIFPGELAERLWVHAVYNITLDLKAGKDIVPSRDQINSHLEHRRQILLSHAPGRLQNRTGKPVMQRGSGTHTWIEPCPKCGLEKRCDAKTKNFRCKNCGFDQPYPFKPASP